MRVMLTLASAKLPSGMTEAFLRDLIRATCQQAMPTVFARPQRGVKIEVALVTDAKIAKLNREYRGKDAPTDVLSFGEFAHPTEVEYVTTPTVDLGTLILSLPYIRRSAKEDGVSWKKEFVFVFVHGVLHLLGHDHSKEMFALQDELTEQLVQ